MDEPRTVPAVSASGAEEFFTSGTQAWPIEIRVCASAEGGGQPPVPANPFLKIPAHTCYVGVDTPGVGHIAASGRSRWADTHKLHPDFGLLA
jgi:hypothetical protein